MYYGTSPIVTNGLVGYFDTSNSLSYVTGSLIWKDLTGTCDLLLTGSGASPIYWLGSRESIPSIATTCPNIQPFSNDFTNNLVWTKNRTGYTSTITASAISAPPGLPGSGSKLNETTVDSRHGMQGGFDTSIGTPFRVAFYARAAERSWIRYENMDWSNFFIHFDLVNGVTGSKNLGPITTNGAPFGLYDPKIENAGNGWWRCSFYVISGYDRVSIGLYTLLNDTTTSYVGTATSGVHVYGVNAAYGTENVPYVDTSTTSSMNLFSAYLEYTGSAIQENNEHSVFTWVKGFTSPTSRNTIYSKYTSSGAGILHWVGNDYMTTVVNTSTSNIFNISSIFNNARPFTSYGWCQVGITRSATQVKYYWNGVNIGTTSRTPATTSSATVKFGDNTGEGDTTSNGRCGLGYGNILIYNRAITEQEAIQNFNAMKTKYRLLTPQTQFGLRTTTGN